MTRGIVLARDDDNQIKSGICDECGLDDRYHGGQCKKCTRDWITSHEEERHGQSRRDYKQSEKGKMASRAAQARRRTAKIGGGGSHSRSQFRELCRHYDCHCLRCGGKFPLVKIEADHVVAVSNGGSSDIDNIQPLCRRCNVRKGAKNTDYRDKVEWDKFGKPVFWWQDGLQL